MATFSLPKDLIFNRGAVADPTAFARENAAASWLYLNGAEFASMEGGMSYADVQRAVPRSANVVTDPPRVLDLALARQHVAALDQLPRPTLVTCRKGPRASAVAYMYAGLKAGAEPDQVLVAARAAGAPFCDFEDYQEWVKQSIVSLRSEKGAAPMNPNKALWEKGDFTRIAGTFRQSSEALVATLGITKGMKVLDVGCGDGNTALPEARLGADVLGVDIARNLVDAGNRRAREEGLTNCRFQEGDATNLQGIPDAGFELVVSFFGAMFAPRPMDVARELVRVTRRGGRIVMGNWIPNDPTLVAQILKISSAYSPPPPQGFVSPMAWGVEGQVIERFEAAGVPAARISFARDTLTFRSDGTPAEFLTTFRAFYGPTMNAFEAAEKNGKADELQRELQALFESQNTSPTPGMTVISATFLRVTVVV
jgi:SAM-dependent methyltransferase